MTTDCVVVSTAVACAMGPGIPCVMYVDQASLLMAIDRVEICCVLSC